MVQSLDSLAPSASRLIDQGQKEPVALIKIISVRMKTNGTTTIWILVSSIADDHVKSVAKRRCYHYKNVSISGKAGNQGFAEP